MRADGLAGKTALITAGGSGIGRAVAVALAAAGVRVIVTGRTAATLEQTVKLADEATAEWGGQSFARGHVRVPAGQAGARAHLVDVTDPGSVRELFEDVEREYGTLDIAVNNAGRSSWGPVADILRAEWDDAVGVNLTGVWLCLQHEIALMRRAGGGAVVNVVSRIGIPMREENQGAYAAGKAAVSVLTRTAARECIGSGIRVNAVSPGPTDTAPAVWENETPAERDARVARTVPIGRLAAPAEIAAAVRWLVSAQASYVVGHDLVVDGGLSA